MVTSWLPLSSPSDCFVIAAVMCPLESTVKFSFLIWTGCPSLFKTLPAWFKTRYPSLSTENEPFLVYRMPCDVWMQKKPFPFKAKS